MLRPTIASACLLAAGLFTGCGGGTVELAGTVERTALELAAPISEVIVEMPVGEGNRVVAGAVVVKLDQQVAEAELRAFEAAHAAADAAVAETRGELARQADLRKARVSTQQSYDAARRRFDEAAAILAEKEARIAQAKKRLEDLTVRSHRDGLVDQLPFEVGERAPAGGVVAVVLADEAPWVRIWLPARAVARLGEGSRAEVKIEGLDETFEGTVEQVAREPEFTPHYALTERESAHLVYEARLVLPTAPRDLRPGLPAQVRLRLGSVGDG